MVFRSPEDRTYQFGSEPAIKPLVMGDLQGPFLMYAFFSTIAFIAFGSEIAIGKRTSRLRKRNKVWT